MHTFIKKGGKYNQKHQKTYIRHPILKKTLEVEIFKSRDGITCSPPRDAHVMDNVSWDVIKIIHQGSISHTFFTQWIP